MVARNKKKLYIIILQKNGVLQTKFMTAATQFYGTIGDYSKSEI